VRRSDTDVHEHISDLRQPMAVKGRVRGFVMCNKLSNTVNVRMTLFSVSETKTDTSSASSVDTS
jgi:hypothetical protein